MNRFLTVVLCLLLLLCGVGCRQLSPSEGQTDAVYEIPANLVTPGNGELENYYIPSEPATDWSDALRRYCESEASSPELSDAFRSADSFGTVPVFGTDLEATRLFLGIFSKGQTVSGAFLMCQNPDGTLSEAEFAKDSYSEGNPISNAICTEMLARLFHDYPEFQLAGVVYQMDGWKQVYPVGQLEGRALQYYDGMLCDFSRVDPFRTVAEGRASIEAYLKRRAQLLSELPIYLWQTKEARSYLGGVGYLSRFKGESVPAMNRSPESFAYLNAYDDLILVPLLDETGRENVYQLLLLYRHNQLIAELLLKRDPADGRIGLARERIAPQNADGGYIGLSECTYAKEVRSLLAGVPAEKVVRGVAVTNDGYRLILG